MTDYLDRLLEQQEQEEAGGLMEWHSVYLRGTAQNKTGVAEAAETAAAAVREAELSRLWQRVPGAAQLLQQVQRLHRAVRQAGEQGHRTVSSQTAVQWDAVSGRHGTALSARRTVDYAAAVDLAFQRDARRYDGPMELPR